MKIANISTGLIILFLSEIQWIMSTDVFPCLINSILGVSFLAYAGLTGDE